MAPSHLDTWPVPAVTCRRSVITEANRSFCETLGYEQNRILGRLFESFLSTDFADDVMDRLDQLAAAPEQLCPVLKIQMVHEDKSPVDLILCVFDRHSENEWSAAAIVTGRVAQRLEAAADSVRESADTLRMIEFADVTTSLIQDLAQPVTAIQVAGEIVEQQCADMVVSNDFRRLIGIIGTSGQMLSGQLRLVRHFARNRRADIQLMRLADVLEDTIGLMRPAARQQLVQLELAGDDQLPPIRLDPGLIQLALMSALNQVIRMLTSSPDDDRRILVMHRAVDGVIQEIGIEFRQPESQPDAHRDQFENCRLITELHGGQFLVEAPATAVVRCCLRLGVFP